MPLQHSFNLSRLTIALYATVATMTPLAAHADQTIGTDITTPITTVFGVTENVTVTSAGSIRLNSGGAAAITAIGTISTLTNDGVISGPTAIVVTGSGGINSLVNTHAIGGDIVNNSTTDLTITGGAGSVFGSLGSFVGGNVPGLIINTASNVVFSSGNTALHDNIDATGHAVNVTGGTLKIFGPLAILGNYNQSAAATLQIAPDNLDDFGTFNVSGSAVVDAGSTVALKSQGYNFVPGQRYVVIQAATAGTNFNDGALTTTADNFGGTIVASTVVDGGHSYLVLTLSDGSGGTTVGPNPATAPAAAAALGGLLKYGGVNANLLNLFDAAAALDSAAAANSAGAKLSPSANTVAAVQSAAASTVEVQNVISTHIDGLRLAQAQGISGVATGESASNPAVWGQAFGGQANQGMRDGVSGYHAGYNGLLVGVDRPFGDNWRAGGLFSYANTSVASTDDNTGSSAHVVSYGLMAYAGYTADRWYMDFSAGAVRHQFDTVRAVDFTGFSGSANGHFNGTQYVASARAGYPVKLDAWMPNTTLTPIVGLAYSGLVQDAYTESGGNGAALSVRSGKNTSVRSEVAAKLERVFSSRYGDVVPSAQLGWRHEFQKDAQQSGANFAADPGGATGFTSAGAAPLSDSAVLALGVTLLRSKNLSLSAKYTLEAASGFVGQTADLRLRYQF